MVVEDLYPPAVRACQAAGGSDGLARSIRLFRAFLKEQSDPQFFYTQLAADAVRQLSRYCQLDGRIILDIGGGSGETTRAFRSAGAHCYLVEPDKSEMLARGDQPPGAVLADGFWLPASDGAVDACFSSNVLEHTGDPLGLIEEMIRVTKPGGIIYLSFTNWYSPWGGHEMSPWHYLGSGFAERRYRRRYGRDPKHTVGITLFRTHIGTILRTLHQRSDVKIIDAFPRYYPHWCKPLLRVPLLREFAAWNLLIVMRRAR
jgi:SAM-dependent methyltransferase